MAGLWLDSAPASKRTRQRIVGLAMLAITIAYLFVELAFNFTLVNTLGSPDQATDGITPTSIAGMTEMGLRLTATAVTLLFLGWLAGNYANDEMPFSIGLFRRSNRAYPWGLGSFVVSAAALTAIWLIAHKTEDKVFEAQEWMATAQERQDLHIGLNATKLALVLASEAAKPGSTVKPVMLDIGDTCLAVTEPRAGSILLDEEFLSQPGARPLIAAMPHLLALRWGTDGVPFEKKKCEIIARWKSQLPDATVSYQRYVAPAMRTLEEAYDAQAPHIVGGVGLKQIDLDARMPLSMLTASGGMTQAAIDTCTTSRTHLDFRIVLCLWHEAHAEAARRATAAGVSYREGYLQRRQTELDRYQQVIADREQAAQTLPNDFSPMSDDQRRQILDEVRNKAETNRCLIDLDIVQESIPTSLDGINSCEDLAKKIENLAQEAGLARCKAVNNGNCSIPDALRPMNGLPPWTPEGNRIYYRRSESDCKTGSAVVEQCRAAILGEVSHEADKGRVQLANFPLDPQRGMREALSKGIEHHITGDPALWPLDIQSRLRTTANAMIAGATDRAAAAQLALTDADPLPACGATQDWAEGLTYARLPEDPQRSALTTRIASLPWCTAYTRIIRSAGARAYEHQEAMPATRAEIRNQIAASLRDGGLSGQDPETLAYIWIDDDWMPETETAFSSRIERLSVRDIVRPAFAQKLSAFRLLTPEEALTVLDADPKDLRELLAMPVIDQSARRELATVLNGAFAYAGLSPDQVRGIGLRHPLAIAWQDAWRTDIYQPLIDDVEKSVLETRLLGATAEYGRRGNDLSSYIHYLAGARTQKQELEQQTARCYSAGHAAYYLARLPTLGLGLSVAGLLLHSAKATYYVLKLLSLGWVLRWLGMLVTPLVLIFTPILRPAPIIRSPLAQELFKPAEWLLPWIVSAQTSYQPISRSAHAFFADDKGHWNLDGLADPARVEKPAMIDVSNEDPRVVAFKDRWPELAAEQLNDPDFRKMREMLASQFLCRDKHNAAAEPRHL